MSSTIASGSASLQTYPIDTIKTRIQTSSTKKGFFKVLRSTIETHGFRSLYTGITQRLYGALLQISIIYAAKDLSGYYIST